MTQVIGLTGYAGSGKDTAALGLIGLGWERLSFAGPVYDGLLAMNPIILVDHHAAAALGKDEAGRYSWTGSYRLRELVEKWGWDRLKRAVPEVRRLLQTYGTEAGRHIHGDDCWLRVLDRKIEPGGQYVITDVRFANEVELIHSVGGAVVRIHRPGVEPAGDHSSEDIDALRVDLCIQNIGAPWELKSQLVKYATGDDPIAALKALESSERRVEGEDIEAIERAHGGTLH